MAITLITLAEMQAYLQETLVDAQERPRRTYDLGVVLRALVHFGFTELRLHRIVADCDPSNRRSLVSGAEGSWPSVGSDLPGFCADAVAATKGGLAMYHSTHVHRSIAHLILTGSMAIVAAASFASPAAAESERAGTFVASPMPDDASYARKAPFDDSLHTPSTVDVGGSMLPAYSASHLSLLGPQGLTLEEKDKRNCLTPCISAAAP